MIKGVIFDVDGTLLDSMPAWKDASLRYLASLHVEGEKDLSEKLERMSIEEGAAYVKERYQLEQSPEEIAAGTVKIVEDFYVHEAKLKPGVRDLLEKIEEQKIPMVIATSSIREHVEAALKRLGVFSHFRQVFTCSEVGMGKRQPEIYERAGGYLQANPEEICVFEDALHAVATAKKAGFYTVAVYDAANGKDWTEITGLADYSVRSLSELYPLIEEKMSKGKKHEKNYPGKPEYS